MTHVFHRALSHTMPTVSHGEDPYIHGTGGREYFDGCGGAAPPTTGYFKRIREIRDRYGVLPILDGVMCGMGGTGTVFSCEQDDAVPGLPTLAA